MTPPRYDPILEMTSNVTAVPKSITMAGPCRSRIAAEALARRSAPILEGLG